MGFEEMSRICLGSKGQLHGGRLAGPGDDHKARHGGEGHIMEAPTPGLSSASTVRNTDVSDFAGMALSLRPKLGRALRPKLRPATMPAQLRP